MMIRSGGKIFSIDFSASAKTSRCALADVPSGNGHVLLFSTNPFWRGQTKGSYFLVFNAILNWDNLNAGRKLADK